MEALNSKFAAVTTDPLNFYHFLINQHETLYQRVVDLIIFEEVANENFRLQKLYQPGVWDLNTAITLDVIWYQYCHLFL